MARSYVLYAGIALILVAAGIGMAHLSKTVHRLFNNEVAEKLHGGGFTASSRPETVTEQDVERLPEPVRKYLRYAGVVGKPRVRNARFVFEGDFKLSPKQNWIRVRTDQYNFFGDLTRIFYIKGRILGVAVTGRDLYAEVKGNMFIRATGLITVADTKGSDMDASGLIDRLIGNIINRDSPTIANIGKKTDL